MMNRWHVILGSWCHCPTGLDWIEQGCGAYRNFDFAAAAAASLQALYPACVVYMIEIAP